MKKKDVKTKVENALNLTLFDLQITPSKRIKKSITAFAKEFSHQLKMEWKKQVRAEKAAAKVATKRKKQVVS